MTGMLLALATKDRLSCRDLMPINQYNINSLHNIARDAIACDLGFGID